MPPTKHLNTTPIHLLLLEQELNEEQSIPSKISAQNRGNIPNEAANKNELSILELMLIGNSYPFCITNRYNKYDPL